MAIFEVDPSFERWDFVNMAFIQCDIQVEGSSMRDRVTFCIKTIHRPHCCATLVRSIFEQCGDKRPLIHVLDDGRPDLRFSKCCPEEAELVDRLVETEYDIGLSAGRNRYGATLSNVPLRDLVDDSGYWKS